MSYLSVIIISIPAVSLQVYNDTPENGANVTLRCNHTYVYTDVKLMIELPPVVSERPSQKIVINCSRQHAEMYMDVQCGTVRVSMMPLKFNSTKFDTHDQYKCALLEADITCNPGIITLMIVIIKLRNLLCTNNYFRFKLNINECYHTYSEDCFTIIDVSFYPGWYINCRQLETS